MNDKTNLIDLNRLAKETNQYSGADIESIVKEGIEQSFIDGRTELTTERLLKVIGATHPLGVVMKDKVKQYKDRFAEMKIKSAS